MHEKRIMKPVEIVLRRRTWGMKENNGECESN
jgi:hypothetical protein